MKRNSKSAARRRVLSGALALGLLVLGSTLLAPVPASAERDWGYDLAHELMSPFCPGRTLATCPSPQASELVQWIVMQEAAGVSREQVIEMLIERHGEQILGAPPAEGITLWAYIFPVLGFLVGGALAFVVLRRIVGGGQQSVSASAPVMPAPDSQSLDDELGRIVDAELSGRS